MTRTPAGPCTIAVLLCLAAGGVAAPAVAPGPAAPLYPGPTWLLSTPGGAVLLYARSDEAGRLSEILGQRLDRRGQPAGLAYLLRRTSGRVIALGADRDYDTMWIGWVSDRDRGRQRLVAALQVRADLSRPPGRTVTLADFPSLDPDDDAERRAALARRTGSSDAQVNWRAPFVRVGALPGGGAVVIAPAPVGTCIIDADSPRREGSALCPSYEEVRLGADGVVENRLTVNAFPEDQLPGAPVPTPWGLLYVAKGESHDDIQWTGRKGALWADWNKVPHLPSYQSLRLAWTGESLVSLGTDYAGQRHLRAVRGDGRVLTGGGKQSGGAVPLREERLSCRDGRPVLTLRHDGGAVDLDAGRPGAVVRLAPPPLGQPALGSGGETAWTGEVLVAVVGGALCRWRCVGETIEPE